MELARWHHPGGSSQDKIDARNLNDIASTYTMADALFSASLLNACLRNADVVSMANVSPSVNTRGPIFAHKNGIVKRTTFHTMKLYVDHIRETLVPAQVNSSRLEHGTMGVATVDAIVSRDGEGTTIALVNRDPDNAAACQIILDGKVLTGQWSAAVLDGDSPDAFNSVDAPDNVVPRSDLLSDSEGVYSLPPHALCMLQIPS